jgi:hypothetical protein
MCRVMAAMFVAVQDMDRHRTQQLGKREMVTSARRIRPIAMVMDRAVCPELAGQGQRHPNGEEMIG